MTAPHYGYWAQPRLVGPPQFVMPSSRPPAPSGPSGSTTFYHEGAPIQAAPIQAAPTTVPAPVNYGPRQPIVYYSQPGQPATNYYAPSSNPTPMSEHVWPPQTWKAPDNALIEEKKLYIARQFIKILKEHGAQEASSEPILNCFLRLATYERKIVMASGSIKGFLRGLDVINVNGNLLSVKEDRVDDVLGPSLDSEPEEEDIDSQQLMFEQKASQHNIKIEAPSDRHTSNTASNNSFSTDADTYEGGQDDQRSSSRGSEVLDIEEEVVVEMATMSTDLDTAWSPADDSEQVVEPNEEVHVEEEEEGEKQEEEEKEEVEIYDSSDKDSDVSDVVIESVDTSSVDVECYVEKNVGTAEPGTVSSDASISASAAVSSSWTLNPNIPEFTPRSLTSSAPSSPALSTTSSGQTGEGGLRATAKEFTPGNGLHSTTPSPDTSLLLLQLNEDHEATGKSLINPTATVYESNHSISEECQYAEENSVSLPEDIATNDSYAGESAEREPETVSNLKLSAEAKEFTPRLSLETSNSVLTRSVSLMTSQTSTCDVDVQTCVTSLWREDKSVMTNRMKRRHVALQADPCQTADVGVNTVDSDSLKPEIVTTDRAVGTDIKLRNRRIQVGYARLASSVNVGCGHDTGDNDDNELEGTIGSLQYDEMVSRAMAAEEALVNLQLQMAVLAGTSLRTQIKTVYSTLSSFQRGHVQSDYERLNKEIVDHMEQAKFQTKANLLQLQEGVGFNMLVTIAPFTPEIPILLQNKPQQERTPSLEKEEFHDARSSPVLSDATNSQPDFKSLDSSASLAAPSATSVTPTQSENKITPKPIMDSETTTTTVSLNHEVNPVSKIEVTSTASSALPSVPCMPSVTSAAVTVTTTAPTSVPPMSPDASPYSQLLPLLQPMMMSLINMHPGLAMQPQLLQNTAMQHLLTMQRAGMVPGCPPTPSTTNELVKSMPPIPSLMGMDAFSRSNPDFMGGKMLPALQMGTTPSPVATSTSSMGMSQAGAMPNMNLGMTQTGAMPNLNLGMSQAGAMPNMNLGMSQAGAMPNMNLGMSQARTMTNMIPGLMGMPLPCPSPATATTMSMMTGLVPTQSLSSVMTAQASGIIPAPLPSADELPRPPGFGKISVSQPESRSKERKNSDTSARASPLPETTKIGTVSGSTSVTSTESRVGQEVPKAPPKQAEKHVALNKPTDPAMTAAPAKEIESAPVKSKAAPTQIEKPKESREPNARKNSTSGSTTAKSKPAITSQKSQDKMNGSPVTKSKAAPLPCEETWEAEDDYIPKTTFIYGISKVQKNSTPPLPPPSQPFQPPQVQQAPKSLPPTMVYGNDSQGQESWPSLGNPTAASKPTWTEGIASPATTRKLKPLPVVASSIPDKVPVNRIEFSGGTRGLSGTTESDPIEKAKKVAAKTKAVSEKASSSSKTKPAQESVPRSGSSGKFNGLDDFTVDDCPDPDPSEEQWQETGKRNKKKPKFKSMQAGGDGKENSAFDRLVAQMLTKFPNLSRVDSKAMIQQIRTQHNGFAGMKVGDIIYEATKLLKGKQNVLIFSSSHKNVVTHSQSAGRWKSGGGDVAAPQNANMGNLLYKTSICEFWKAGTCGNGDKCIYAHGRSDLRPAPKYILCSNWKKLGRCPHGPACLFAHGDKELIPPPARSASSKEAKKLKEKKAPPPTMVSSINWASLPDKSSKAAPKDSYEEYGDENEEECAICCDPISMRSLKKLECGHEFHANCIKRWLEGEERTCPLCRSHALLIEDYPYLGQ